ncbi:hypothetical protein EGI22_13520 [Lacihabitans sp. LS3-19]|uniref:hypothetical protein n=1 Tax=Lacihabitans sp. LS3-19 TaxID=2487335 RepID=UPI0020CD2742|nr:hypothetical protein [Lacihabitans sp. LS3-19]MCP9768933.1 hypothetical protein [Lacihabitans sp. LS3-19]
MSSSENNTFSENIGEYLELQKEKLILNLADRSSKIMANLAVRIAYLISAIFFVFFLSLGVALLLNNWLNSSFLGFLIVSIIFLFSFVLLLNRGKNLFRFFFEWILLNIIYDENT